MNADIRIYLTFQKQLESFSWSRWMSSNGSRRRDLTAWFVSHNWSDTTTWKCKWEKVLVAMLAANRLAGESKDNEVSKR